MSLPPQPHSFLLHHQDPHAGPQMFLALSGPRTLPTPCLFCLLSVPSCLLSAHFCVLRGPPAAPQTRLGACPPQPCALPSVASFTPRSYCLLSVFLPLWCIPGRLCPAQLCMLCLWHGAWYGTVVQMNSAQPLRPVSPCLSSSLNPASSPLHLSPSCWEGEARKKWKQERRDKDANAALVFSLSLCLWAQSFKFETISALKKTQKTVQRIFFPEAFGSKWLTRYLVTLTTLLYISYKQGHSPKEPWYNCQI